jgi:nucleotide-binding universal stress UspA family protein
MILEEAREQGADLIALTTHGGSKVTRRVFGGTTEQMIHGSTAPLLIVPSWADKATPAKVRRIVVPLDGSKTSEMILPLAWKIGQRNDAAVILTHVLTAPELKENRYAELEGHFRGLVADLDKNWMSATIAIVEGKLPKALLDVIAHKKADLVVMSAHGYGAMKRMLFGSEASKLIRESPVPVIVLKQEALSKLAGAAAAVKTV